MITLIHRHPHAPPAVRRSILAALALSLPAQAAEPGLLQPFNTERSTNGPLPAAEVVSRSILPPGFRMSVFAAEPHVHQPIGMATDPAGRLWVAENYTYSEQSVGYHPQLRDRIVVFEDVDNDGQFDRRILFWDGAERLTSVEVGLGGVWALALPHLLFIPDEDGDAVPDGPPRVILDGFEYKTGRHTVANGLRWGPDGWLYGRHGIQSTSRIGPPGAPPEARAAMNAGLWRYHPVRRATEVIAQGTTNPWGMDWNAEGELFFINTVIGHLWHVIPGAHYRRMYGDDPTPYIYEVLDQTADHVHWASGEVWTDVRKGVTDRTSTAGGGHAHTGLLIYQGGQWPADWSGRLLTINFHGRRLNVERLERQAGGYIARHNPDACFFADPWFRGIDLLAAPDGGVFVSDWSDAGECHDQEGIHRTSGRIYKISQGEPQPRQPADLRSLSDTALAGLQTSPNDWQARQARRVLADRARRGARSGEGRDALRAMAMTGTHEVERLRALWALHVSGSLDSGLLQARLRGTEHERAWAVRLLEDSRHTDRDAAAMFDSLAASEFPRIAASDPSALVRLTLASLLQRLQPDQRFPIARALLGRSEDAGDRNLGLMIWYGIGPLAGSTAEFTDLIAQARIPRVQRLGARRLAEDIDTSPEGVNHLLASTLGRTNQPSIESRQAVLDGLADGFAGRHRVPKPKSWAAAEPRLASGADESLLTRIRDLNALFGDGRALDEIQAVALDPDADLPRRRAALRSLVEARAAGLRPVCERLLPVRELSATAASGLALFDDPAVADLLIAEWPNLYGHERPPVMNALLSRPAWAAKVLEAVAQGRVRRSDLGVAHARQIRAFNDESLNRRLAGVWGTIHEPDAAAREQALHRWRTTLTPEALKAANPAEGRKVYTDNCGGCHKLYGTGGNLGPDLTGAGRQNLDYLLENLIYPNALVPAEFRQTTLSLRDGRILTGLVRSRSAQAVVLDMIGETATVSRSEIEEETPSELSMMPEGLLDALDETQARALIRFLMSDAPPSEEVKAGP